LLRTAHQSFDAVHSLKLSDIVIASVTSIVISTVYGAIRMPDQYQKEGDAMERQSSQIKPYIYGVIIFLTLGLALANETLSRIGMEGNRLALFSVAFVVAIILLSRNLMMVIAVVIGVLALNLPETVLLQYHLDRDMLLALIGAAVILPSVYGLVGR